MSQPANAQTPSILRILLGILAAGAVGLALAIVYLIAMRQVMGVGRGMDGLALVVSLILFPVASAIMGPVIWLPLKLWRQSKGRTVSAGLALVAGACIGLSVGYVFSGSDGFKLHGGAPAFNYAFTALGAFGALAFHALASKAFRAPAP